MKLWHKHDEWTQHASCWGSEDHTLPPERVPTCNHLDEELHLPVADVERVTEICGRCRVRPECIKWATNPDAPASSVWVAGRWIPDKKRAARRVREELVLTLPYELESRGEDV
ncbi:WhiB family transcription factor [Mycobacterium phage EniyanLRS]|uniref:WhiB family transcription factor n=1 Tax=Mycobacterium phage EniyanLRS TaxID=1933770 RepID=A0A2I2MPH6_9CAUD|nr:WhiB family transcription factor [Mycobacterium phage EniyanLRS]